MAGSRRSALVAAHAAAIGLAVAGVVVQLARPLAPDVGAALPAERFFDAAYLQRVAAYRAPAERVMAIGLAVRLGIALGAVLTVPGRRWTEAITSRFPRRPALAAATTITAIVVVTDVALSPLAFWLGYVHDGRFGLRTYGFAGWLRDWVVVHVPVWAGVFAVTVVAFCHARGLVVAFGAPLVLEPLEFTVVPLGDGPVRSEVERVLAAAAIPTGEILVADASRRTTRQNAYVSGLGRTKRIVLYDTLIRHRTPAEVGVVLGHEIGHRRNGDLWRQGLLGVSGSVVAAYALWAVLRRRTRRGRQAAVHDPAGAATALAVAVVLVVASLPVQQVVSRRAEAAADAAALQITGTPETMITMQVALTRSNLGRPEFPTWVELLWASHPAPVERLTLAQRWDQVRR